MALHCTRRQGSRAPNEYNNELGRLHAIFSGSKSRGVATSSSQGGRVSLIRRSRLFYDPKIVRKGVVTPLRLQTGQAASIARAERARPRTGSEKA